MAASGCAYSHSRPHSLRSPSVSACTSASAETARVCAVWSRRRAAATSAWTRASHARCPLSEVSDERRRLTTRCLSPEHIRLGLTTRAGLLAHFSAGRTAAHLRVHFVEAREAGAAGLQLRGLECLLDGPQPQLEDLRRPTARLGRRGDGGTRGGAKEREETCVTAESDSSSHDRNDAKSCSWNVCSLSNPPTSRLASAPVTESPAHIRPGLAHIRPGLALICPRTYGTPAPARGPAA